MFCRNEEEEKAKLIREPAHSVALAANSRLPFLTLSKWPNLDIPSLGKRRKKVQEIVLTYYVHNLNMLISVGSVTGTDGTLHLFLNEDSASGDVDS